MLKANARLLDRIIQDPEVMVGKPVVRGTRIPVERVVGLLALNPDLGEVFAAYPELTLDDVKACLQFAQAAVAAKRPRRNRRESILTDSPTS